MLQHESELRVILGCDPLLAPLTGIGNYTRELASGLDKLPLGDFKLFAHGAFFSPQHLLLQDASDANPSPTALQRARGWLATQPLAVASYKRLVPTVEAWRLKRYAPTHLYHSPNFLIPKFDGPVVTTFHDMSTVLMPECHPASRVALLNEKMAEAVQQGAHIITCSALVKAEVCQYYGLPESRVDVVPLAADQRFRVRTQQQTLPVLSHYNLIFGQFFLFVSTIEPRKNLLRQLRAFARYWQQAKQPLPLVIVGGAGWNSEAEHKLIQQLQLSGAVVYLGYIPTEHIPQLYSAARALLFVSRYEGFGLPLLEAMQSGCPVITADNSAMAELSKEAAILVDYQNEDGIYQALLALTEDDWLWQNLREQGLMVANRYSWSETVKQTTSVYQRNGVRS